MNFAISQSKVIRRSSARIDNIVTEVTSDIGAPSTHLVSFETVRMIDILCDVQVLILANELQPQFFDLPNDGGINWGFLRKQTA